MNGQYQIIHVAADTYTPSAIQGDSTTATVFPGAFSGPPGYQAITAHQIGFGFSYSTVSSGDRGPGRIPFEVTYRHLETISASGGATPKTFEDQLSLRIFFHR
jgi:hypothetical protein